MSSLWAMLTLLLLLAWGVMYAATYARYPQPDEDFSRLPFRLVRFAAPMLFLLDRFRLVERFPRFYFAVQRPMQVIYDARLSARLSRLYIAELLNYTYLLILLGGILAWGTNDGFISFGIGVLLGVLVPVAMLRELKKRVIRREQEMLLELPEVLNHIILLVDAGETVQRALVQCVERKRGQKEHPLYHELQRMVQDWQRGDSFLYAFEQFSKRCAVQEIAIFTTTILLNYRRGGTEFVLALRDLSRVLWDKRKAISLIRGEEASSKLVFPMVIIFFILLVLVCTPMFLMMSEF